MDRNESEQWKSEDTTNTEQVANGRLSHHDEARRTEPTPPEKQEGLYEEVEQLRLEVERLRDQQQALQRIPQSNDTQVDDDSNTKQPADRGRARHWRPVRLIAALIVAA